MSSLTPNYNFTVCTGSDLVNPLTQIFPNFTSLDTILRNIANSGITVATEIKTGTVHALTRVDPNVPMIRFQAVSRFDSGDTFTVDGVSVTATLPDGETLPDGGYIIGSMVLCELRDTQLTVYTSDSIANVNAAFNIGNTDISEIGDGSIKGAISAVDSSLSEIKSVGYGADVDIHTYTSLANAYTTPANGYVVVDSSGDNALYLVIIYGSDGSTAIATIRNRINTDDRVSIYVPKGCRVVVSDRSSTIGVTFRYFD